jgi:hypothetical protein
MVGGGRANRGYVAAACHYGSIGSVCLGHVPEDAVDAIHSESLLLWRGDPLCLGQEPRAKQQRQPRFLNKSVKTAVHAVCHYFWGQSVRLLFPRSRFHHI